MIKGDLLKVAKLCSNAIYNVYLILNSTYVWPFFVFLFPVFHLDCNNYLINFIKKNIFNLFD
jgi:hypothetical protein